MDIETLDINAPDQRAALRESLAGQMFDMLFVNAGVSNNPEETIADVTTDEFVRVMVTNALSPLSRPDRSLVMHRWPYSAAASSRNDRSL